VLQGASRFLEGKKDEHYVKADVRNIFQFCRSSSTDASHLFGSSLLISLSLHLVTRFTQARNCFHYSQ
jgi:hypothetical protein